jgi:signal transduction histidine kinase
VTTTTESGRLLQILLIEDDADDVLLCRDAIGHSDLLCQLDTAGTLREAIERLDRVGADVALVDLSLPDAEQLDAVTALARRFAQLPIVVLTGLRDEQTAARALHAGAEDYLIKGLGSRETIGRAVRYAIERKRGVQTRLAKDAAEAANQAKSVFISRMSHELRTPLTAILGFAQILEIESPDQNRELARYILTAGRHLQGLISEVLDFARVDAGELGLSLQPVRLSRTIGESVALIRPLAADRDVTVRSDLSGAADVDVVADPQRLSQVLLNLLSNAVKYNNVGGAIEVACTRVGDCVRAEIRDTGIGLGPDQLASLFTPFNRLGAEDSGVEGTGLGLVITKRLVEAMGATMGLDSAKGVGTTVWTEWAVAGGVAATAQPESSPAWHTRTSCDATVLYIEDNPVNIALVERILAYQPGMRLVAATTATDGFGLARSHHPDLILLDLNLPDMTGDTALRKLRDDPTTHDIPVIVITADATPANRSNILAAGACAFLTKPFQVQEFLDAIDAALSPLRTDGEADAHLSAAAPGTGPSGVA